MFLRTERFFFWYFMAIIPNNMILLLLFFSLLHMLFILVWCQVLYHHTTIDSVLYLITLPRTTNNVPEYHHDSTLHTRIQFSNPFKGTNKQTNILLTYYCSAIFAVNRGLRTRRLPAARACALRPAITKYNGAQLSVIRFLFTSSIDIDFYFNR